MPGAVRIAVLGVGRIGLVHAGNIAASHPRAQLACIYDINADAAASAAATFGAKVAPDLDTIWHDPQVDAVVIATSTDTHVELITAAARAGKAILCEKPIDLNRQRVEQCRRDIAGSGVPVQIGFNRRYDRSHRAVRDAVRQGSIGALELLLITSRDPGLAPLSYLKVSGGIFRDMTIHDFDMARFILGPDPILQVYAAGSVMVDPALEQLSDADTVMIVMKAASGALVHINNSRRAAYGYDQRVEAFGALGMVQSENIRASTIVRSDAQRTASREPLLHFFIERYRQSYVDELHEFIEAVAARRPPEVGFDDGRAALMLADAALESFRHGKVVSIDAPH
jgi:myo-inositol 2-dehydrogenase/D-chiro-inositol 1-dehydrogenase